MLTKIFLSGYRIYRNKLEHITKKYSNYFAWSWTFICTYGVLFWCSTPLVEEWSSYKMNPINYTFKQRNLPYIAWYPLNTNDIHTYAYLYIMQVLGGLSSGFGIVFYDSFYVSMLLTSCAQFQYINIIMMKIDFDKYDLCYRLFLNDSLIMEIKYFEKFQHARGWARSPGQVKEMCGLSWKNYEVIFLLHLLCEIIVVIYNLYNVIVIM